MDYNASELSRAVNMMAFGVQRLQHSMILAHTQALKACKASTCINDHTANQAVAFDTTASLEDMCQAGHEVKLCNDLRVTQYRYTPILIRHIICSTLWYILPST